MLEKIKHQDLQVYCVWVPILWGDGRVSLPQATKRLPDQRVSHYWDHEGQLVREYARVLQIDGPAWDVYLLYDRNAEWKEQPPTPTFWMDKLGLANGTPFEGDKLAQRVQALLETPQADSTK